MLLTGVLSSLSSSAKQLTVEKVSTVWDTCAILLQAQSSSACIYIAKEHIRPGINSTARQKMRGRSLALTLPFLSSYRLSLSFFQSLFFSPFLFPTDTCRQAHTSREPASEKCNLSIPAPQRKDKQCWKYDGVNTLPSRCWTNMLRFPSNSQRPCHVRCSQVWKFKDILDCACGRSRCFWGIVCLSCLSLYYCLTDSLLEGTRSYELRDRCS